MGIGLEQQLRPLRSFRGYDRDPGMLSQGDVVFQLVLVGGVLGLALALAAARLLGGLLFEVDTLDPLTFVGVPLVLAAAALLAAWLPARRASRVHPVTALRTD